MPNLVTKCRSHDVGIILRTTNVRLFQSTKIRLENTTGLWTLQFPAPSSLRQRKAISEKQVFIQSRYRNIKGMQLNAIRCLSLSAPVGNLECAFFS